MKAAEDHLLIFEGARAGRYPQRSRPSEQRRKNRQMASALRVAEITGRGLCWLRGYSPLRGCAREAALPAAHGLPGRCFASATASRNGLYAIKSAVPEEGHVASDGQGGFWTKKGHVTSDGRGGYWTNEGHVASDGQGGYWTKDGHITSDGRGGFWVPGKKGCPSIFGH